MSECTSMRMIQSKASFPIRLKVAAYARVSSSSDTAYGSLSEQTEYYERVIRSNPQWLFVGVFHDQGISGTVKDARKGFLSLLKEADNGNIDIILTKSISRFARNTVDLLETVRHLKGIGVSVRFERENIDTSGMEGELLLTLLAGFAEAEAESASEARLWSVRKGYEKGISCHGHPPYGYRWNGPVLMVFPAEAENVKRIFSMYLDGIGTDRIAAILNNEGLRKRNGTMFYGSEIRYILVNETYIGDMILQKKFTVRGQKHKVARNDGQLPKYHIEDDHEAIISRDVFDAVQEEMKRRSSFGRGNLASRNVQHTTLTGRILCAECGRRYVRNGANNGYWICATKTQHGKGSCGARNISDKAMRGVLSDILGGDSDELISMNDAKIVMNGDNALVTLSDGSGYLIRFTKKNCTGTTWEIEKL